MTPHDLCAACGHARCFHQIGEGTGVPYGMPYCSNRHGTDAEYNCACGHFIEGIEFKPALKTRSIYVIGSMRNPRIPEVAIALRGIGLDAYDDWHSSGPESDDYWMAYEKARGRTYREALAGVHANNVFELDKRHLDRCDACVLVMPAGKSGHLELGYMRGCKKPGYILLDGAQPDRYDIMSLFATAIFDTLDELTTELSE